MNTGASTWSKAFRLPRSSTRGTRSPRRCPRAFSRGTKLLLQPTKSTKLWTTSRPACPLPTHRPKSSMSGIKYHRFPIPLASVCACVCVCVCLCLCLCLSVCLSACVSASLSTSLSSYPRFVPLIGALTEGRHDRNCKCEEDWGAEPGLQGHGEDWLNIHARAQLPRNTVTRLPCIFVLVTINCNNVVSL